MAYPQTPRSGVIGPYDWPTRAHWWFGQYMNPQQGPRRPLPMPSPWTPRLPWEQLTWPPVIPKWSPYSIDEWHQGHPMLKQQTPPDPIRQAFMGRPRI